MQKAEHITREDGPATARTSDADRTRADILKMAAKHFAKFGLSGSRVDEISDQTHTSKRMLYYYFGSKEGLYRAVLAQAYDRIRAHEMEIDLAAISPTEGLARLVEITFDHHRLNEDFVRLVMVENIHHAKHIAHVAGIEARAQSIISLISGLLVRGQASGEFRKDIDALQVHMNVSGLAFFNVSNRHTIAQIFKHDLIDPAIIAQRRAVVVDTILRWVCVTPPVSV